jgi:hypothetical protein
MSKAHEIGRAPERHNEIAKIARARRVAAIGNSINASMAWMMLEAARCAAFRSLSARNARSRSRSASAARVTVIFKDYAVWARGDSCGVPQLCIQALTSPMAEQPARFLDQDLRCPRAVAGGAQRFEIGRQRIAVAGQISQLPH